MIKINVLINYYFIFTNDNTVGYTNILIIRTFLFIHCFWNVINRLALCGVERRHSSWLRQRNKVAESRNCCDNQVQVPSAVRRYFYFEYHPQFLLFEITEAQNHETRLPRCVDYQNTEIPNEIVIRAWNLVNNKEEFLNLRALSNHQHLLNITGY